MPIHIPASRSALAAAMLLFSASAHAASDPTGIWFDHNGRGAVEIKACASGTGLCGHVVHVKDARHADRCGLQILGEVTPDGGGWVYSPERKRRYDVALKRLSDDKLRVVGNAGSRFFSRTYTWNRAPDDIARCGETTVAAAAAQGTDTETKPETKPETPSSEAPLTAATANPAPAQEAESAKTESPPEATPVKAKSKTAKNAKPASKATKTATVSDSSAAATSGSPADQGEQRRCKYRIPYVGRTISVPCRKERTGTE